MVEQFLDHTESRTLYFIFTFSQRFIIDYYHLSTNVNSIYDTYKCFIRYMYIKSDNISPSHRVHVFTNSWFSLVFFWNIYSHHNHLNKNQIFNTRGQQLLGNPDCCYRQGSRGPSGNNHHRLRWRFPSVDTHLRTVLLPKSPQGDVSVSTVLAALLCRLPEVWDLPGR